MWTTADADQAQRWRLMVVGLSVTAFAGLVAQNLHWYQVTDHENLVSMATAEHQQRLPLPAKRGGIYDTNGNPLAVNVMYDDVWVYRPEVRDPQKTATKLAEVLDIPVPDVSAKIRAATDDRLMLASRISSNAARLIESANLGGVELRRRPAREYPEGSLAPQVLGFVGVEDHGLSGLELTLDDDLGGRPGLMITERDTVGGEIAIGRKAVVPSIDGSDVVLTIDRYVQRLVERELAAGIAANKGIGGVAIVMEPSTGSILAMASLPTYSLTADAGFDSSHQQLYKPVAVTDTYEPGSVMKLITMSAAIDEHVVTPDTPYVDTGVSMVNGIPIRNWDGGAHGNVTVREILVRSLNTGTSWVAGQLGPDRFYRYVEAFGFGKTTGVRLNGEAAGAFRRPNEAGWSATDLATNAFGQSIAVTPVQLMTAISAIGNNGILMQPRLVRQLRGPDGTVDVPPRPVRPVVSSVTADTVLDMMVSTWNQPALQQVHIDGYKIAAKSGTADIPGPGGYSSGKTYASFVGFSPLPNPRFAVMVRIDHPESIYGGVAAAPVFSNITRQLLNYYRIAPSK
ncbi:MAG: penicillin-binding protein 2 [Chloroflexi bacterium]|nr:penicillin-binding protein 2 [Chloroflexota bacterium]